MEIVQSVLVVVILVSEFLLVVGTRSSAFKKQLDGIRLHYVTAKINTLSVN